MTGGAFDHDPSWIAELTERLASDAAFRTLFAQQPGRAANSIGIPYSDFRALVGGLREPGAAVLGERHTALVDQLRWLLDSDEG
jgi:hypothetical protein